jgi:N-acetylglucosamine kinase-like BadF-type ATPase
MILIADSGSTNTNWRIIDAQGKVEQAQTKGINPYFQSSEEIQAELQESLKPQVETKVKEIHFYGAGCNNKAKNMVVETALTGVFGNVVVFVNSDLLAVARGLCGREPGIACILGTGSNSCYYDGDKIVHHIPPWGTWLGDEGSGSVMGRKLVIYFLNKELPDLLMSSFETRYPDLKETILEHVYRQPYPNRYLGQFSKFLFDHMKDPFIYQLVYSSFQEFLKRKVLKYPDAQECPIHFSGSIAFYFNTILRQAAGDLDLHIKNITENPIAGLTLYHNPDN